MFIQVLNISLDYQTNVGVLSALREVSFDVLEGRFITIIGPSGCGKSSLLNVLGGILQPSSGEVLVNRIPLTQIDRRNLVGFVFQEDVLLPWRNILENVRLPLEILHTEKSELREKPLKYLEMVGLLDFRSAYPRELSGGMKQRVGIARALVSDPPILLMDEPFAALDEITRMEMSQELLNIWQRTGKTIIFVTHSINEAVFLSDQIIVLTPRPGRIVRVIDVTLSHPRNLDILSSREFFDLMKLVRNSLQSNASKVRSAD
jgi:NitT/TauT family transport system ATP-binding protein